MPGYVSGRRIVCSTCGTQYPSNRDPIHGCFICNDPRLYIPHTGQAFIAAEFLRANYRNTITPYDSSPRPPFYSIQTTPKFGFGQRAILIPTPAGNVLWDCLTMFDASTASRVKDLGGIGAMVISTPHYYPSHADWSFALQCDVYLAEEDVRWVVPKMESHRTILVKDTITEVRIRGMATGLQIVKVGGRFPGSLVALYQKRLFVSDTLMTTPSGLGDWKGRPKPRGMNTFSFMWSIWNSIPLSPAEIWRMWGVLKGLEFKSTHGSFPGQDIEDEGIKGRMRESMVIQTAAMGWEYQTRWDIDTLQDLTAPNSLPGIASILAGIPNMTTRDLTPRIRRR